MGKPIRIYKILPVADGIKNWGKVHEELLASIDQPDVEITQVDLPDSPITEIKSQYHTELVANLHTLEAVKGAEAGYDGVVMGCLDEPGVAAAKELLTIPIVGQAEASMHYASIVGRRFSFVKGGEHAGLGWGDLIVDLVHKYGFGSKLASVRHVVARPLQFAAQKNALPNAMLEQARRAIEDDGADVIIGYGGLDVINYLQDQLGYPVISPILASVMMIESLVRLNLSQSKHAFPNPG